MITESSPPVGPCGRPLEHVVLATFQRHIHDGDLAYPSQIHEHIDKCKSAIILGKYLDVVKILTSQVFCSPVPLAPWDVSVPFF